MNSNSKNFTVTVVLNGSNNNNKKYTNLVYKNLDFDSAMDLISGRYSYRLIFGRQDLIKV